MKSKSTFFIYLSFVIPVLQSCSSLNDNPEVIEEDLFVYEPPLAGQTDTIELDDYFVIFEQIDFGGDFEGDMVNFSENEEDKILETEGVFRLGDTLNVFADTTFIDISPETEGKYWREYIFQGQIGNTNLYEIMFAEYLGYIKSIVISDNNHSHFETVGRIFPSKDDKFLVSANYEPKRLYGFNGLEIFVLEEGEYKSVGKIESEE